MTTLFIIFSIVLVCIIIAVIYFIWLIMKSSSATWIKVITFFIGIITIFPLLGMLGTVVALIAVGANFQNGSNIDVGKFFLALTSTAYGIIFSIIFKLLNFAVQPFIENQISKAKAVLNIED